MFLFNKIHLHRDLSRLLLGFCKKKRNIRFESLTILTFLQKIIIKLKRLDEEVIELLFISFVCELAKKMSKSR